MGSYQNQWPQWSYTEANDPYSGYQQYSTNYSAYLADSMEAYQTQHQHLVHHHHMSRTTESKPRLSKDEVEVLEAEFQKNHKPNSSTKKALAESMRVDNARINNWFQNRRAREKKERNIREYEARQKLEKEKKDADPAQRIYQERKNDLVAYSAPFPGSDGIEKRDSSSPEHDTDAATTPCFSDNDVKVEAPSQLPQGLFSLPRADCTSPSNGTDSNEPEFSLSTDEEDADYKRSDPYGFHREGSASYGSALRSPPSLDIASRRNRRPPPLSINGPRSNSAGGPRTAYDMSRRADSMRRVASATGTMRVTKPMGVPRSPFQLSKSPVLAAPKANAPPTPDTPILTNQPETNAVAEIAMRDPTLRTPPTTPGGIQPFFSLNSIYDMPLNNDNYVPHSMSNFTAEYSAPISFSSQVNSAQPQSSSFVSPPGYSIAGNTEYNWPSSVRDHTSQQGHFLNIPASGFSLQR